MGYIGYYMKKEKWWGYAILFPMILLTARSYYKYLGQFLFYMPKYCLVAIFCAGAMILYPILIFNNEKIRKVGGGIGAILVIAITAFVLTHPPVYSTEILGDSEENPFDDTYKVSLKDEKYGDVKIVYVKSVESYMVHANLKKAGKTVLILESPMGEKKEYDISIEYDNYEVTPR